MSFSASGSALSNNIPIRFHQIRADESLEKIASKYSVDFDKMVNANPGVEKTGDIVVIDLKDSSSALI
jgi:hypothetical protein